MGVYWHGGAMSGVPVTAGESIARSFLCSDVGNNSENLQGVETYENDQGIRRVYGGNL